MKKAAITSNQRKLLEAICDSASFEDQVTAASEIWPTQSREVRRSFSRLSNLGFTEWVPQAETSFEARWAITEKGVRHLTATM